MTGLGDRVRALHLGRRVDGGDPLLNTVWLDVPELRDALAAAIDALESYKRMEHPRGRGCNLRKIHGCNACRALAAVARQLEDGAA